MESYSRYVGDRGVEEAMKVLLGNGFDASNPAHWVPEQVARLEEYPPYDLTPHLQDQLSVEYTAGQTDTVKGYIDITMRHLAATIATCRLTSSQNETTRRAFIDPILVLVCTFAASLRSLKPGLLQLCMEYGVDQANNSGKIDYVLKHLMALLLSLVVAKGDGGLAYHRGQTLAELAAVKQSNVVEGRKRNWDETQSPAIAVLTNSSDWEFYVYRPLAEPPVVYWEIATPTEMLWKDLAKLRQRFMPVIEQLLAIVLAELDRVQERQVSKKKRTGP